MKINLALVGFGRVGRAFVRLVGEKRGFCREVYGLDLDLRAVFNSRGAFFLEDERDFARLSSGSPVRPGRRGFWKPGLTLGEASGVWGRGPGVLVECTPTDIRDGEPGLGHMRLAMKNRWHVAAASKGALVLHFGSLMDTAERNGVRLKFSAAAAAALPGLDVGCHSLAGSEILGIEGILTGTANFILDGMERGASFGDALREAQSLGIAEPDPSLDVDGWDTACKILLISNAAAGTHFTLKDVRREGISHVSEKDFARARESGRVLKLLGRMTRNRGGCRARVGVEAIEKTHPLSTVSGTGKAVTFITDAMGSITVSGGNSSPRATAAALLKDIINIFRG